MAEDCMKPYLVITNIIVGIVSLFIGYGMAISFSKEHTVIIPLLNLMVAVATNSALVISVVNTSDGAFKTVSGSSIFRLIGAMFSVPVAIVIEVISNILIVPFAPFVIKHPIFASLILPIILFFIIVLILEEE